MHNTYISFLEDINEHLEKRFPEFIIPFRIIGYAALELAGLPERGTKDMDALKTGALVNAKNVPVIDFLINEFGKKSPGSIRHGIYLDLVAEFIPWFPKPLRFIEIATYSCITASRLNPTDVCVSKVFSLFKSTMKRANDGKDIFNAIDREVVELGELFALIDNTFQYYETHAEAAEVFPKVINFLKNELVVRYNRTDLVLKYEIPNWMENI